MTTQAAINNALGCNLKGRLEDILASLTQEYTTPTAWAEATADAIDDVETLLAFVSALPETEQPPQETLPRIVELRAHYYRGEFDRVRSASEPVRLQLSADGEKTRWMNLTAEQLKKIEQVLLWEI